MIQETVFVLALVSAGSAAGFLAAPLAAPYVEDVSRGARIALAASTGVLYGVLGLRAGAVPVLVALLYLAGVGLLMGFIDVRVQRLPDRLTLPSYGIAAVLLGAAAPFTADGTRRFGYALAGMAVLFAIYALQAILVPRGMGLGDVKLSGVLGMYLGWFGADVFVSGLLLTYFLGGGAAVAVMVVRRSREGEFAFGPFMLAGAVLAILAAPSAAF